MSFKYFKPLGSDMNTPRLKWDGAKFIPANWEATGIAVGWNIELDLMEIVKRQKLSSTTI